MANKRKKFDDKRTVIVRAVCIVLALLMFGGVLMAAVLSAKAVDGEDKTLFGDDDYIVRVGISFRDGTLDSHRVRTNGGAPGFDLYSTTTSNQL